MEEVSAHHRPHTEATAARHKQNEKIVIESPEPVIRAASDEGTPHVEAFIGLSIYNESQELPERDQEKFNFKLQGRTITEMSNSASPARVHEYSNLPK